MRTGQQFWSLVRHRTLVSKTALGLCLLLAGFSVPAQPGPLFHVERDWTLHVGGQTFGMTEWRLLGDEKYGGGRHTTFFIGTRQWMLMTRTARVVEVALPLGLVGLLLLVLRGPETSRPAKKAKP